MCENTVPDCDEEDPNSNLNNIWNHDEDEDPFAEEIMRDIFKETYQSPDDGVIREFTRGQNLKKLFDQETQRSFRSSGYRRDNH